MDYFAKTFTNKLREHNVISSGEFNIYYYGFEILFSTTFIRGISRTNLFTMLYFKPVFVLRSVKSMSIISYI